jgi:hypothetical protein
LGRSEGAVVAVASFVNVWRLTMSATEGTIDLIFIGKNFGDRLGWKLVGVCFFGVARTSILSGLKLPRLFIRPATVEFCAES